MHVFLVVPPFPKELAAETPESSGTLNLQPGILCKVYQGCLYIVLVLLLCNIHLVTWALFLSSLIPSLPTINGGA